MRVRALDSALSAISPSKRNSLLHVSAAPLVCTILCSSKPKSRVAGGAPALVHRHSSLSLYCDLLSIKPTEGCGATIWIVSVARPQCCVHKWLISLTLAWNKIHWELQGKTSNIV